LANLFRYTTLVFVLASVISGIFANQFVSLEGENITRLSEARWVFITIMPVLLMVNFVWVSGTAAKDKITIFLQVIGQTALFAAPYYWVFNHA